MNKSLLSSKTDLWETPQDFFEKLNDEFNFNLDPCALPTNAKCSEYFTPDIDGLKQDWGGKRVFCNPPYGRKLGTWVKKCYEESKKGTMVVMLIPARTDTAYFHDYIYNKAEIRFLRGRLKFSNAKNCAPFPSMLVIYANKNQRNCK